MATRRARDCGSPSTTARPAATASGDGDVQVDVEARADQRGTAAASAKSTPVGVDQPQACPRGAPPSRPAARATVMPQGVRPDPLDRHVGDDPESLDLARDRPRCRRGRAASRPRRPEVRTTSPSGARSVAHHLDRARPPSRSDQPSDPAAARRRRTSGGDQRQPRVATAGGAPPSVARRSAPARRPPTAGARAGRRSAVALTGALPRLALAEQGEDLGAEHRDVTGAEGHDDVAGSGPVDQQRRPPPTTTARSARAPAAAGPQRPQGPRTLRARGPRAPRRPP